MRYSAITLPLLPLSVRMPLFFLLLQLYLSEARRVLLGARLACVFLVSGRRLMLLDRIG